MRKSPSTSGQVSAIAFDRKTGAILHIHHFVSAPGARPIDAKEVEAMVKRDAAELCERRPSDIGVMLTDAKTLASRKMHRVDVKKGKLVALKRFETGQGSSAGMTFPPRE